MKREDEENNKMGQWTNESNASLTDVHVDWIVGDDRQWVAGKWCEKHERNGSVINTIVVFELQELSVLHTSVINRSITCIW